MSNMYYKSYIKIFGIFIFIISFFLAQPVSQSMRFIDGDGHLTLHNLRLGEKVEVQYRKKNGSYYNRKALKDIEKVLRCRLTNETHEIPIELLELVDQIQDHFGGKEIKVISGYRSPKLNKALRRQGRRVASRSLHMRGWAMDIRIPGVSSRQLQKYALSLKRGGVGRYSHFVHVDIGRVRRW